MVIQVALKNEANESASILDDSMLGEYNDSIQRYNPILKEYLDGYTQSDGKLIGSSPFMQVHLSDSGLLPGDTRCITRSELEAAIYRSSSFLRNINTDVGIVLFTPRDSYSPNDLPAKIMEEQLKNRGIELGNCVLVPLTVLSLEEDTNSAYGAVFRLNDKANKDNVLDLRDFKWGCLETEGMVRVELGTSGFWYASSKNLGVSHRDSAVAVVSGEATSQKILKAHLITSRQEKDAKITEFQEEYAQKVIEIQREYGEKEALLRVE